MAVNDNAGLAGLIARILSDPEFQTIRGMTEGTSTSPRERGLVQSSPSTNRTPTLLSPAAAATISAPALCTPPTGAPTPTPTSTTTNANTPVTQFRSLFPATRSRPGQTRGRGHQGRGNRYAPYASSPTPSRVAFSRDVVLLSDPLRTVPRGARRLALHNERNIISAVRFQRSWTETEVREHLRVLFAAQLEHLRPEVAQFNFLMALGPHLVVPNVGGEDFSGGKICATYKANASIYLEPVDMKPEDEQDICDEEPFQSGCGGSDGVEGNLYTANQRTSTLIELAENVQDLNTANQGTLESSVAHPPMDNVHDVSTADCEPRIDYVARFGEMFTQIAESEIQSIVENNMTLSGTLCEESVLKALTAWCPQTLADWREATVSNDTLQMVSNRMEEPLVRRTMSIYKKMTQEDMRSKPEVRFVGENGVDGGALFKEHTFQCMRGFVHLVVEGEGLVFEGENGHKLPVASTVNQDSGLLEMFGKVIAHSVLHEGCLPTGFSPALVHVLSNNITREEIWTVPVEIADVPDPCTQEILNKDANELLVEDKTELAMIMSATGVGSAKISESNWGMLRQQLVIRIVVENRWEEIQAIRRGMDTIGLSKFLSGASHEVCKVFRPSVELHPEMILDVIDQRDLDNVGENGAWLVRLLQELHSGQIDGCTLDDLLVFWIGYPDVSSVTLRVEQTHGPLPVARACFFTLRLSRVPTEYAQFKEGFVTALTFGSVGYGMV